MTRGARRKLRRARGRQGGLTLIELLVVVTVLALLAGVVVLNVTGISGRGQSAACQSDLKSIQTAVTAYYGDHGSTYPTAGGTLPGAVIMSELVPDYLHSAPTTPGTVQLDASGTATAANC